MSLCIPFELTLNAKKQNATDIIHRQDYEFAVEKFIEIRSKFANVMKNKSQQNQKYKKNIKLPISLNRNK